MHRGLVQNSHSDVLCGQSAQLSVISLYKPKGSNFMKKTITFWIASIAAVLAVILRVVQLSAAIDFETGFFYDSSSFVSMMLYILFGVCAVVLVAGIILDKKKKADAFEKTADSLTSRQTLILGVSVLVGALLTAYEVILHLGGELGIAFFGELLVAIVYLVIAFTILSSKQIKKTSGYLMAVIAISYTLKAAGLFMGETVVTRLSEELLLLLTYIVAVFFFLCCGRFLSRNEAKFSRAKLVFFSAALLIISSTVTVSKFIAFAVAPSSVSAGMSGAPVSEIGTLIVSACVLGVLCARSEEQAEKKAEETEEAQELIDESIQEQ